MSERGMHIRDRTLVLRILVPGLEAQLRDKMRDLAEIGGNAEAILDLEGVACEPTAARNKTLWNFHCDGATYPAKLVNLPCPVEIHKTHDHAVYYKAADVAQMLIVYEDDIALQEADEKPVSEGFASYYHSGLSPPLRRVVERRFAARDHPSLPPPRAAVQTVEDQLVQLMEQMAKKEEKGKNKRNKVPAVTTATKVLEEVEEHIVDYEPWMDDYGKELNGIEFDADDQICSLHPEVWLDPDDIQTIKEEAAAAAALAAAQESTKKSEKKSKKKKSSSSGGNTSSSKSSKKKEAEKSNPASNSVQQLPTELDEVEQAASSMLAGDNMEFDGDLFGIDIMNDLAGIEMDDLNVGDMDLQL